MGASCSDTSFAGFFSFFLDLFNEKEKRIICIGLDNAGKTTIITALDKVVNNQKFGANDFNFIYLTKLLNRYKRKQYKFKPTLYFQLIIGIDEENDILKSCAI